jgi:hypothetical protein
MLLRPNCKLLKRVAPAKWSARLSQGSSIPPMHPHSTPYTAHNTSKTAPKKPQRVTTASPLFLFFNTPHKHHPPAALAAYEGSPGRSKCCSNQTASCSHVWHLPDVVPGCHRAALYPQCTLTAPDTARIHLQKGPRKPQRDTTGSPLPPPPHRHHPPAALAACGVSQSRSKCCSTQTVGCSNV